MFPDFFDTFSFAFSITGPIFVLVFLGIALKQVKLVDAVFTDKASKLIFNVALPSLLFFSILRADLAEVFNGAMILVGILGTFAIFLVATLLAPMAVDKKRDRGVFIQGAFRGNLAIIGLAFCDLAYGGLGVAKASIFISLVTLFYSVLSIYTLSISLSDGKLKFSGFFNSMLKNPIMIGIVAGIAANLISLPLPAVVHKAGSYLSNMTLPLALICIGASVSLSEFKRSSSSSLIAAFLKLIVTPTLIVGVAYLLNFDKIDLGVLFFMVSAPTAAVSYVMAQAMGGNGKLAANIIAITTLLSLVTVSFGLAFLRFQGVV